LLISKDNQSFSDVNVHPNVHIGSVACGMYGCEGPHSGSPCASLAVSFLFTASLQSACASARWMR